MDEHVTVAAIDNHPIVLSGLAAEIGSAAPAIELVGQYATVEEFLDSGTQADVVLLDLLLEAGESIASIPALRATGAKVLLYTSQELPVPLREAVGAGADGLLLKSDPTQTILEAIQAASRGEFYCSGPLAHALLHDQEAVADLPAQQVAVLRAIADGLSYPQTARALGLSEGTVKTYLARVREKYRLHGIEPGNSHHLVALAREDGHLR